MESWHHFQHGNKFCAKKEICMDKKHRKKKKRKKETKLQWKLMDSHLIKCNKSIFFEDAIILVKYLCVIYAWVGFFSGDLIHIIKVKGNSSCFSTYLLIPFACNSTLTWQYQQEQDTQRLLTI